MKKGVAYLLIFILFIVLVNAPPPATKTVRGTVYDFEGGFQVNSGTFVHILDTFNYEEVLTTTGGPPGNPGSYSTSIFSAEGDIIRLRAYNATHWGEVNASMGKTGLDQDIYMNMTRTSETNVTITIPNSNSNYAVDELFNITANITILGADATSCSATLSFSNPGILTLKTGETFTHSLGDGNLGSSIVTYWNVTTSSEGTTNIIVNASCGSDSIILEYQHNHSITNISVQDNDYPILTIFSPLNHSRITSPINFFYNVTDSTGIANCSLYINDIFQQKTDDPIMGDKLNFSETLSPNDYEWNINCTDNSSNEFMTGSGIYNLSVNARPQVISITTPNPINLVAAANETLTCNGTIEDQDGYKDFASVNATLFNIDQGASYTTFDNKSIHYTDTSCDIINGAGNNAYFNCTFSMEYYALNGTWVCNATVLDFANVSNSSIYTTEVSALTAISVEPSVIDYGSLEINEESPTDIEANVTNYGNIVLDLELFGYAIVEDDNLSMDCTSGDIEAGNQRYELTAFNPWSAMTQLTGRDLASTVSNFNLGPRTEDQESIKPTYWKLKIPTGTSGTCEGRLVFTAVVG